MAQLHARDVTPYYTRGLQSVLPPSAGDSGGDDHKIDRPPLHPATQPGRRPQASLWQLKEGRWGVGIAATWRVGAKALAHHGLRKHEA